MNVEKCAFVHLCITLDHTAEEFVYGSVEVVYFNTYIRKKCGEIRLSFFLARPY